jgi:integrase/recombinase XerD
LKDWLDAAETEGGHPHALACLLAINGLRVGEACGADVTDLAQDRWHHTLTIHGKADKTAVIPLPPRTVAAIDAIVAALNAGVSLRDVQEFARHADPRTTIRYDRARHSLDRHASYAVMQYVSGAA